MSASTYTFGDLKTGLRAEIWPAGEAQSLHAAHDRAFIDAVMDIQKWVECMQQDNVMLVPQCSTYYKNGVTIFAQPYHSFIKRLSTVDRLNEDTGVEDPEAELDWTSEIMYTEVHPSAFWNYFDVCNTFGCCYPIAFFFGIPDMLCQKAAFPFPKSTGIGVPDGVPVPPLGMHYPEASTNRSRALAGVWMKEGGKIYVAPWIQSTETIVIRWEGFKREWTDDDPFEDDPFLRQAIRSFVLARHCKDWDRDYESAAAHDLDYRNELQILIHNCREETRQRPFEKLMARGSSDTVRETGKTYWNKERHVVIRQCDVGTTGTAGVGTVEIHSVKIESAEGDVAGQAAAEAAAQLKAEELALANRKCTTVPTGTVIVCNQRQDAEYPMQCDDPNLVLPTTYGPIGNKGLGSVEAGVYCKSCADTTTAKDAAQAEVDGLAHDAAVLKAMNDMSATYYNKGGEIGHAACASGDCTSTPHVKCYEYKGKDGVSGLLSRGDYPETHEVKYFRPKFSTMTPCEAQEQANILGQKEADRLALEGLKGVEAVFCDGDGTDIKTNTPQFGMESQGALYYYLMNTGQIISKTIRVIVTVPAGMFEGFSQENANQIARNMGQQHAFNVAALINASAQSPRSWAVGNAAPTICMVTYPATSCSGVLA